MRKTTREKNKGFSLIELLMVVAIFSILTAVILFNYADFNDHIVATNMAYEVALTIREAQVYSLGVRGESGSDDFSKMYGVYLNVNKQKGDKNFILFYDNSDGVSGVCDDDDGTLCPMNECLEGTECRQLSSLTRNIKITELCLENGDPINESGYCSNGNDVDDLSITFKRPNPDAVLMSSDGTGTDAAIIIEAPNGSRRAVVVRSTGQISVKTFSN